MNTEQQIEGNKMIAEFLGKDYREADGERGYLFPVNGNFNRRLMPSEMQYHSSFDWLMPAVDKIKSLGFTVEIYINPSAGTDIHISKDDDHLNIAAYSTTLEAIYTAVVQFIQWYNQSKCTIPPDDPKKHYGRAM
jgi:hypothetical protein